MSNPCAESETDLGVGVYIREEGMRLRFLKPPKTNVHILLSQDGKTAAERITYVRSKRTRSFEYKGCQCTFEMGEVGHYDNWSLARGSGALEIVCGSSRENFGVRVEDGTINCLDAHGAVRIRATLCEPREESGIQRIIGMISDGNGSELRLMKKPFWENVRSVLGGPGGIQVAVANERFFGAALNLAFLIAIYEMANGFCPQESASIG